MVSHDSVRIAFTIAALNGLKVLGYDIQNAYLTASPRENVWTIEGAKFGSENGKTMLIVRSLYGLKSSGAAFRVFIAETFDDIGYRASYADPDVWTIPAIKDNEFRYWELVLWYVYDLLCMIHQRDKTMDGIKRYFNLKDDKVADPDFYLGASIDWMQK